MFTWVAHAAGEVAPLSLTMAYAAPETVEAYVRGEKTVVADSAVDVWAVGVMAFELYTHRRVLNTGTADVRLFFFTESSISKCTIAGACYSHPESKAASVYIPVESP